MIIGPASYIELVPFWVQACREILKEILALKQVARFLISVSVRELDRSFRMIAEHYAAWNEICFLLVVINR